MKTSNRVRAKSSAAKVAAQTENQPQRAQKEIPFEDRLALIAISDFYTAQKQKTFCNTLANISGFYHVIKHHPALRDEAAAMLRMSKADEILHKWLGEGRSLLAGTGAKIKAGGYEIDEWEALVWFAKYFGSLMDQPYTESVSALWGFTSWIKREKLAKTLNEIVSAANIIYLSDSALRSLSSKLEGGAR